jgi:hypothetical protein
VPQSPAKPATEEGKVSGAERAPRRSIMSKNFTALVGEKYPIFFKLMNILILFGNLGFLRGRELSENFTLSRGTFLAALNIFM